VSAPASNPARDLAATRAPAPHTSMFLRMLVRAAMLRRGRAASALFALVVAAAVATAMLNLYVDVQAKLRTEFRNYGANIVLVGSSGASLPADALARVDPIVAGHGIAVPFGMIVARTGDGQPIVVAGTDFERARQLDRWWKVSAWPSSENPPFSQNQGEGEHLGVEPHPALVGVRALAVVSPKIQPFPLSFQGRTIRVTPAGTVETGAGEDSRIYLSLDWRATGDH
jgi:putative ABC transport system permease protein